VRLQETKILFSWALYDFANTIFSAVVLTAYFPVYLTSLAGANWYLGAAAASSMILAAGAVPLLGALSDQTGKTKRYLIRTTLAAVIFQAALGLTQHVPLLLCSFLLACFFFHASLVFYNSLLPVAAAPQKQGWASGLGTGLGYLGVVCSLPIAHLVDLRFGRAAVFTFSAALFLLFSLPLFFFVPERRVREPVRFRWRLWKFEWGKIRKTLKGLSARPALFLFLAGNFFTVDALNAAILWLAVYAREVFHPGQAAIIKLLMAVNACAFCAGILHGFLTDRVGARRMILGSASVLALTLVILALAPGFNLFGWAGTLGGGLAAAGIWTAGRKALVELAEADRVGEYFGLYGLTTKISVIGSLAFSVTSDLAGFRPALWVLVFPASAGCMFLFLSLKTEAPLRPG